MEATHPPLLFYVTGAALLALLTYVVHQILKIGSRPVNLPPGPPTAPIWGNLKQLAGLTPQVQYAEWAKQYGPVYSVMQGSQPFIIVNGAEEARDLFIKRGQYTAARPASHLDLVSRGDYFPSMMSGPQWQTARKLWQSILNVGPSKRYLPYQDLEVKNLLADTMEDPKHWRVNIERFSNSIAMSMTNGHRVVSSEDPNIAEVINDLLDWTTISLRGGWFNAFPSIWELPELFLPILKEARQLGKHHKELVLRHYAKTKARASEGAALPSFNRAIQEKLKVDPEGLSERQGAEIGMALLTAATDTTASSLINWVAAMVNFPEAQRKAREEIDRVVGHNRLPREEDAVNLPYVRQMTQELLRWVTVTPIALPHAATAPMKWRQWDIPAGTGFILNAWAIHNDPKIYPEPREFRPERWEGKLTLGEDSAGAKSELFAFGAGRRICPGQYLAERSIFLVVSHWLWAFDIAKAKDAKGNEIPVDVENNLRPGLVVTIMPFEVSITPRSEEKAKLVRKIWAEERDMLLDKDEQWRESPEGIARLMLKVK